MNKGLRAVAAFTLFFFLTTQCVSAAPGAGIEMAGQRELPSYLSIDIPAELGTVDALYEAPAGANPQFILHIQNAHANYQAQMKIKQLLGYMNKKYGFKTIFVEGASEKLDPDYLRLFPDQERNLKLCDELAKQGELTGAELYMMEADKNIEALGIEQASLYKANYEALKIVFGAETDVTRFFKGFDTKLDRVASKTFTPETRELIADWKRFEQGRRDFMPFVKSLTVKSKKILNVDLESLFAQVGWPQISRLLVIQQLEKEMNKAKGQEEQAKLINWLRGKGVSKELLATLENFNEGSIAVGKSATEVSPREVLERLAAEAGPKGFKFSDYPAFSLFAGYVTLRSELDPKVLFEEIEYLFTQMLDTLAKEPQQKALLALYRDGELLRKLLHLELNRTQWRQAVAAKDRIAVPSLVSRLKDAVIASGDVAVQKDQQVMPKAFSGKMDELFTAGLEFYDFAHQREAIFYKQMQTAMTDRKITKAILITGGFHTDGMSDLFRENSISYGIVTPRLSEKSNENLYQKIMLQNENFPFSVSYLENALNALPIEEWIRLGVLPSERIARDLATVTKNFEVKLGEAVMLFNASKRAVDAGIALSIDVKATRESKDGRPVYKIIPRVMGTKRGEITRIPLDQARPVTPAVGAQESPIILDNTVSVVTGPITSGVLPGAALIAPVEVSADAKAWGDEIARLALADRRVRTMYDPAFERLLQDNLSGKLAGQYEQGRQWKDAVLADALVGVLGRMATPTDVNTAWDQYVGFLSDPVAIDKAYQETAARSEARNADSVYSQLLNAGWLRTTRESLADTKRAYQLGKQDVRDSRDQWTRAAAKAQGAEAQRLGQLVALTQQIMDGQSRWATTVWELDRKYEAAAVIVRTLAGQAPGESAAASLQALASDIAALEDERERLELQEAQLVSERYALWTGVLAEVQPPVTAPVSVTTPANLFNENGVIELLSTASNESEEQAVSKKAEADLRDLVSTNPDEMKALLADLSSQKKFPVLDGGLTHWRTGETARQRVAGKLGSILNAVQKPVVRQAGIRGFFGRIFGAVTALFLAATSTAQAGVNRGAEVFPGWPSLDQPVKQMMQKPTVGAFAGGAIGFIIGNFLTLAFPKVSNKFMVQAGSTAVGALIGYAVVPVMNAVNSTRAAVSEFQPSALTSAISDPFVVLLLVVVAVIAAVWGSYEAWAQGVFDGVIGWFSDLLDRRGRPTAPSIQPQRVTVTPSRVMVRPAQIGRAHV